MTVTRRSPDDHPVTWLVGEHNPYGSDPSMALYPLPENAAGDRLCRKVLGMTHYEYLQKFERRNLLQTRDGRWSAPLAREAAQKVLREANGAPLVLLGARVAAAFGLPSLPFIVRRQLPSPILVLPHPSGRCRVWNDARNFERARACLRELERQRA